MRRSLGQNIRPMVRLWCPPRGHNNSFKGYRQAEDQKFANLRSIDAGAGAVTGK